MNVAVILAGGVGNRLGAGIPKQFVEVLGKPILAYTLEPFEKHPEIGAILVVCVKPYVDCMWELKGRYGFSKLKWVAEGGATFQGSVMNGVAFLKDKIQKDDIVLFHFGASPFIKPDVISDVIRVCKETGTNAISTTDYILLSGKKKKLSSTSDPGNYTDEYINRDTIAVMNTPHAFRYGFVAEMYEEAVRSGVIDTVEPHTTTLMYAMGKPIYFSKGRQDNIKITTKEDLELFEGYVLAQQRRTEERVHGDVVVFLADGFEECEGLLVVDLLRRAGLEVVMASIMGRRDVWSSRGILIHADCLLENVDFDAAKMVVLPGGRTGTANLGKNEIVKKQCMAFAKDKHVAAVCAAPSLLASWGLLRKAAVHPDFSGQCLGVEIQDKDVVVDGNMVTARGLGATIPFALEIIAMLSGRETSLAIMKAICYKRAAGD
jgi:2-C-methyl-D-erythritol 4-phosphate cytidylyltransferase